jgi:hypothetical protein
MATRHAPHTTDLPDRGDDHRSAHRRRRRTAIAGTAVACVVAVSVPFVLGRGHRDVTPPRGPTLPAEPAQPRGELHGDVDGDGTDDTVALTRAGRLRVALGSGTTVGHRVPGGRPVLEGLADVGASGLVVVTSHRGRDLPGRHWSTWRVADGHLARVAVSGRSPIGTVPDQATAWIADGTLYDGALDPLQHGQDRVVVLARSWASVDGRLSATGAGVRCWDRTVAGPPVSCAPGQEWAYDAGPHGTLPALLPADAGRRAGSNGVIFDNGDSWSLRTATSGGPVESPDVDLVFTGRGTTQILRVPPGWVPSMFRSPVRLADGAAAVLLSQEGGDSDTWRLFTFAAGRVQQVETHGPLALGGGFTHDGATAYLSWMSADGDLFTRLGTGTPGHYRVYAWEPDGAGPTGAPVLEARDLGMVCLDETLGTYGTCPGQQVG